MALGQLRYRSFRLLGRRNFIAALSTAAAWSLATRAQQPAIPVVGSIATISPAFAIYFPLFKKGVSDLGFEEGKTVMFDYSWDAQTDKLPALAADLVARRVSIIASFSGAATTLAAKSATKTIPIVALIADDPAKAGLASSLNRPDGNITGITLWALEMPPKQLEILNDTLPPGAPIGVLIDPNSDPADMEAAVRPAASILHRPVVFAKAISEDQFEPVFQDLIKQGAKGVVIVSAAIYVTHHRQLAALAEKFALPAIFPDGDLASSGGLMKYGIDVPAMFRQLGHYAGKILAGAKPGDLPIERPERIELVINMKTAKALGLTISPMLLARADAVIE